MEHLVFLDSVYFLPCALRKLPEAEPRDGGLFAGYIDTFQKLKAEASGYAACVRSPADEELYIET